MNEAIIKYIHQLGELHRHHRLGTADSEEFDRITDEMDAPYDKMTPEEIRITNEVSIAMARIYED